MKILKYYLDIVKKIISGQNLFNKLLKENKGKTLILFENEHIGDTCINCAYLPAFFEENGIDDYVVVVSKKAIPIIEKFGININDKNSIVISSEQIDYISFFCRNRYYRNRYKQRQINKNKVIILDAQFKNYNRLQSERKSLDYKRDVAFRLKKDTKISYPILKGEYKDSIVFESKKPFVIINPYSLSMSLPMELFEEIANIFLKQGYDVYTNAISDQKIIKGTKRLDVSIDELYYISKYAKCIISVRSGILDYIISNASKIIAIYVVNKWGTTYFTLKAWQTGDNVDEILFEGNIDNCINEINTILEE